jgi:hypothetical protein
VLFMDRGLGAQGLRVSTIWGRTWRKEEHELKTWDMVDGKHLGYVISIGKKVR